MELLITPQQEGRGPGVGGEGAVRPGVDDGGGVEGRALQGAVRRHEEAGHRAGIQRALVE